MLRTIRNIGIIAHVDAGKTTLSERVLLYTGRIRLAGETHEGASKLDHEAQEKKHGITITAAAVCCQWNNTQINLIDTPGHVDFTIEVERSLRVLDGAVCVFDGVAGVEAQTETVWKQADRYRVPRICFVNKLDRLDANLDTVVEQIRHKLQSCPVVVCAPIGAEADLCGVVNIIDMKALYWDREPDGSTYRVSEIPDELLERARVYREALLDVCATHSDAILECILEERDVPKELIVETLRKATCNGEITPVLCGSAYRNIGVQPLLDAVVDFLPAPAEGETLEDLEGRGQRARNEAEAMTALCFKVAFDRHGQTSFVRVYSGVLRQGAKIVSARDGQTLRVARLVRLFADAREEVSELRAGDIGAIVGLSIGSGDTLHAPGAPFALESIVVPEPLVEASVEALTSSEDEKLSRALARITRADPSLRLSTDEETGQRRLAGMGQLHLEIAMEKLETEYKVQARIGRPQVAYRQTLAGGRRLEFTLKKQTGGPGMFAKVVLQVTPAPRASGLCFVDRTKGGTIPRDFVRGVETGVRDAMALGVDGIPLVDLTVELLDGATHVNDSSEMAFKIAAQRAILEVAGIVGCIILEPIVKLEVDVAGDSTGAVVADISRRRGRVESIDGSDVNRVVHAVVPLAETFGYAGSLSAMTSGRGRFRMNPVGYQAKA
ncbi:MAG: elongation factor G [Kofleriaceae bacterium]|nr:elongation factor G [Kofleriaceae bacterium]